MFNPYTTDYYEKKIIKSILLKPSKLDNLADCNINEKLKKELLIIIDEYIAKKKACKILIKAKIDELIVLIIRYIPSIECSSGESDTCVI